MGRFILYTVLIFAAMRLLQYLSQQFLFSNRIKHRITLVLPVLELFVWCTFLLWYARKVFRQSDFYEPFVLIVMLVFTALFAWFVLRDLVAGIVLKAQLNLRRGECVLFNNKKYTITDVGYLSVTLETENKETENIDYTKILKQRIVKRNQNNAVQQETIECEVHKINSLQQINRQLTDVLMSCAWFVPSKQPQIELSGETDDTYIFKIQVFVMKPEHAFRLKEAVDTGFNIS